MRLALALLLLAAPAGAADRVDRLAALTKAVAAAKPKLADRDAAARKEAQAAVREAADQALALAREKPADEVAFQALGLAVTYGDGEAAAGLLAKHHLDRKPLADLIAKLPDSAAATDLMRAAGKSKSPEVQAAAGLTLGTKLFDKADRTSDPKQVAEADELLSRTVEKHGTLPWGKGTVKAAADRMLFSLRNLTVGKKAPEFASKDLDGKAVKLSDLKGKVVVLDIWATWCPPCRAMIPHERELVGRMKGKPFALVSVSADDKPETVTGFLETEKMPWTHWFEGRGGPMLKQWNVRFYPTIYVLDGKGVIRFKGVRGKKMDEAVEALLAEMRGA